MSVKNNKFAATRRANGAPASHKIASVAMSALLVWSLLPTAALAEVAEELGIEQTAVTTTVDAEETTEDKTTVDTVDTETAVDGEKTDETEAADDAESEKEATPDQTDASEATIALDLGCAYITYSGQTISAPSTKVTVSAAEDFQFAAAANEGYELTAVYLTVNGEKNEMDPDASGLFTVSAADVATGAAIELETEQIPEGVESAEPTVVNEETVIDASDAGTITGPASVAQGDTITITYNGNMTIAAWQGGDGLFTGWVVSSDQKSLTLTATSNWAFNGSSKTATIYLEYIDSNNVWHTGANGLLYQIEVQKRTFTIVQPEVKAVGEDCFWLPQIKDNETGEIIDLVNAPSGSFYPFEYYFNDQLLENQTQYYHNPELFKQSGTYKVVIKPNGGWIYDFGDQTQIDIIIPTTDGTSAGISSDSPSNYVYDGEEHKWVPAVTDAKSGATLSDSEYTVVYTRDGVVTEDFTSPGTITVTITGQGNHSGSIECSYKIYDLKVNGNDTLEAGKLAPYTASGFSGDVTWSTSDPSIATVDANGVVTAVAKGHVDIIATYGTEVAKKSIEVTEPSSANGRYNATFTSTIENADVVYFNWHNSSDVSNVAFTPATSSFTVNNYTTTTESGYIVFFVKPNDNHIITGLGASGAGQMYAVDATSWGAINGYPGISTVMAAAKAAGYVAAFGYSRTPKNSMAQSFEVSAKSPDMLIAATSNQTKDVAAGDELTFTVTITPQTTGSGKDRVTGVKVNSAEVNGTEVTVENLTKNSDGTYTGYVHYIATDNDCNRGSVVLTVEATTTYEGSFTITSGGITTGAEVTKSATCACQIAPESQVKYQFVSGTTGMALPSAINGFLPWDNDSYAAGKTVKAKDPSQTEYADSKNDGYWTFAGWDQNSAKVGRKGDTVTFTGTWTFTKYSKYTINYVDENGNKIADSKTVGQKKVGDKVKASEAEKPEIEGYTYSKTSSDITIAADESKNVITVTYKQKAGKAGYNLVLDNASWAAPEKTTNTEKMKWYFDYGFAEGDTFTVTNSEPTAADHVFIGWMDKARDGQAAAIRKAGETVTYCYSKNQTYTLDALWASLSAAGEDVTYDGKSHTVTVDVKINDGTGLDAKYVEQAKELIAAGDVQYSTDGGKTWSAEKPSFKDAGTYTVQVKQDVTVGGVTTTLTAEAQVKIAQKEYFVKTNTESKTYDGKELAGTATVEGLVAGESATAAATTVGPNVTASTTNAVTGEIVWAEGTKSSNYKRGTDDLGTLEITKGELTLNVNSYSGKYDGKAHGEAAQINVTEGTTVEYSTDGGKTWGASVPTVKDVAKIDVKVRATNSNYESAEADYTLEVTKRDVTLASASDEKAYDGTALTNDTVTVGGDGFVDSEGATYKVTGSQTSVGSSDNAFTYALNSNTKAENYNITKSEGTLSVKDRDESEKYEITVEGNSTSVTYDGAEHSAAGITEASKTFTNDKGATFTVSADTTDPKSTDVATLENEVSNVKVTDASGNDVTSQFKVTTANGSLTIAKKSATITAGSAEKEYDGKALTTDQFTTDGFVGEQGIASATIEGSQTVVGSTQSTVKDNSWTAKDGTNLDNYEIATVAGTLTVKDRTAKYQIELEGIAETKTYNGAAQTMFGVKSDEFEIDGVKYKVYNYKSDVTGKDAGDYTQTITSSNEDGSWTVKDAAGNDVSKQFSVTTKSGKLTIAPKDVTITSASAEKTYDGFVLEKREATVTAGGFVEGEEAGVSYWPWAQQVNQGSCDNTFKVRFDGTTAKASNYNVTLEYGTLTVNAVTDEVVVKIKGKTSSVMYDGQEHSVVGYTASTANGAYILSEIKYNKTWPQVSGTDAGTYNMGLDASDFENTSKNFTNVKFVVENDGALIINPRSVTLTSGNGYKIYDGTPLTNSDVTVSGDGFVDGEGATYNVTGTITNYGSVENAFTYALNENTKAGNYTITTTPGTLRVGQATEVVTVTITGNTGSTTYDGAAHSVEGYTVSIDGNKLYTQDSVAFNGAAKAEGTDADTYYMGLSAEKFSNTNTNFSNVKFVVNDGSLVIGKRDVTLKSADLAKAYDGTALTNGETALATETGWVEGQGAIYTFTGTQTLVGSSANAFSYTLGEGTNADNYNIIKSEGTLSVTNRDAKYEVTVKANSATATYDGKEHAATGIETSEFTVDGQKYTVSGLATEDPKATDAGTYSNNITGTAVVKDASGNDVTDQFTVKTENGSLVIDKATVTLKSASGEWTYNGTEHTKHDMETVSGFAEGEGVDVSYTGTITNAGEVSNTYSYELNANTKASNYNTITPEYGTLKVNPVSDKVTVTITENSDSKAFNGQEQSVEGYTFSTDNSLYGESGFSFVGDASHKVAKGTAVGTYDMGLVSGDFKNVDGNFSNVEFVIADGQLEITPVDIDENTVAWSTNDIQHKYDGTEVTAGTATATDKYGKELHVQYSADGGQTWVDSPAEIKATNYSDSVTIQLRARADYNTEGQYAYSGEFLQITQRTLNFASASATKKFDGTALTRNAQSDVTVSGDGFVTGEGATFTITGTQTAVGSSKNTFTYDFNSDSTKSENYWVVNKAEGDLTVSDNDQAAVVTVAGLQKTFVYDGQEHFNYEGTDSTQGWTVEGISPSDSDYANYVATLDANPWIYSGNNAVSRTEVGTSSMEMSASQFANTATQFTGVTFDVKQDGWVKITAQSINPSDADSYKGVTVEAPADVVYNGSEQHQKPVVKDANGNVLVEGKDYTLSYSDDVTNAGNVTVTVKGTGNYTGEVETSYQITKRTVNLTSESASKAYDGTALERPNVTVSGDGFVQGEVSDVKATGSVTTYDEAANQVEHNNTIVYTAGEKFNENNYTITKDEGTLRITLLSADANITINGNNVTYVYDGDAHPAGTATATAVDNNGNAIAADFHIEYHIKDGVDTEWRSNPAEITWRNAYDSPVTVEIRVWAKNFEGYKYGEETITISKRPVELKTKSATKVYDGTPLTTVNDWDGYEVLPYSNGGFLFTELATGTDGWPVLGCTGSQTEVGSSTNTINFQLKEGCDRNYEIADPVLGTLTVTAQSIVPDESNPDSYKGATISDPTDVVYNGVEQKWVPEVKDSKGNALVEGADYTVSYSQDLTNVGAVTVTIQGIGNYTGTSVKTYKITAAPLTASTPSATKVYDGTALTAAATAENISGLVNGETATVVANGSQTDEGSSDNGYTIEWGTAASTNYYIQSENLGKLTVTAKPIVPSAETGIAVNDPVSVTYDGQEHKWTPVVTDGEKTLVEGVDYEVSYNGREDFTNVDGLILVTITGKGNYGGSFSRAYRITPAAVSVVTESASKAYDGSALTANGTISGFVNGETATFTVTGSQTITGSSTNTYSIDWTGTAKQSNYTISETLGTLTVTESTNVVVVTTTGYEGVYDGKEHAATVTVTNLPAGYTADATSNAKATDANGDGIAATVDTLVIRNTEGVDVTADLAVEKVDGTIKITPATLKVTTPSASQAYNGSALIAEGTIAGFVDGDYAPFSTTGSQTTVGTSANTYAIDWTAADSTAKASNYTIDESVGELEVTPNTSVIYVVPDGATKVYDGSALTSNGAWVMGVPAGFTYEVTTKGSQTDKGYGYAEVDAFKILDAAGNDVTSNFNNINTEFKAGLVVTARPVTLTSASAEKVYDGAELTAHTATASQTAEGTGMVAGEAFDLEFFGSQTAEGSSANTFVAKTSSTANVDNYDITYTNGTLTVTKQAIDPGTDPQNPDPSYGGVTINDPSDATYDAAEHKWVPAVADKNGNALVNGTDYTVVYQRDGQPTTDFTNVGTITVVITGTGNYTGTVTKTYQIAPAAVTLASNTHEFTYNGSEQSDATVTVSGAGSLFKSQVEGLTATGKVTNAGDTAENTIAYTWKDGFSASNFTITTQPGTLSVVAKSIETGAEMNVSQPGNVVYNGTSQQQKPVVTDGNKTLVEGVDYAVTFSEDTTNAGGVTVTVTGMGNYSGTVARTYEITKRAVTLTSESHAFTYNGQAQSWNVFDCSDGLFASQVDGLGCTASVTNVDDVVTNTVGYAFKDGFTADNYSITNQFGTLSVKDNDEQIVVTTTGGEFTYDGQAHGATVSVSELPAGYTLEAAASSATATDATSVDVAATADTLVIKNAAGADVTGKLNIKKVDGTIKVTPAILTVSTPDAEKVYDGEALLAAGTISGFVNGETATFTTTGSQAQVGESENSYSLVFDGTADEKNYTVAATLGTLKVTEPAADRVVSKTHEAKAYGLGDTVTFTISATNVYDEAKTVTIAELPGVTLDQSVFEGVQSGATVTATATYTVTEADLLAGGITNTATVSFSGADKSYPGEDKVDTDEAEAHLTVAKSATSTPANGSTYALGETISYDVTVTNDGNLTATGVVVDDTLAGATLADGQNAEVGTLAPGASATVKYAYTVTEADVLAGQVVNGATASGTTGGGTPTVTPGSDTQKTDPAKGDLTVTKTTVSAPANGVSYGLGETIQYKITVTNTGNITVNGIEVSDPNADGFETQAVESLAPGASVEFDAAHVVTEADLRAGSVVNVATAKGTGSDDKPTDGTGEKTDPTATPDSHLTVTKTAEQNGSAADGAFKLGETINYTITVTNTGNQTATDVKVSDPNADDFGEKTVDSLAPGESKTFSATHKVTEADVLAGTVVNTATAKGTDPSGKDVDGDGSDTKTVENLNTTLDVEKTAVAPADGKAYKLGETVTYIVTVSNKGNVIYSNVVVSDAQTGLSETVATLGVGESKTFSTTHVIDEADIVAGTYANTATAKADAVTDPKSGEPVTPSGSDTETIGNDKPGKDIVDGAADLLVTKTVTNEGQGSGENGAFKLGDVIEYSITVTNNGNLTAKNFQVVDNNADGFEAVTVESLAPGATTEAITAKHTVTSADILAGKVTNVATTTGGSTDDPKVVPTPEPGETETDVDKLDITLEVTKVATAPASGAYKLGETVTYAVTVSNKGNVAYSNVVVNDAQTGLSETIATLGVGEARTFTTTHVIDESDIVAGTYANTATATADPVKDPETGRDVTPSGTATETIGGDESNKPVDPADPKLVVTKVSDVAEGHLLKEGETVNYTVTVANKGNLTLTNVKVDDQLAGAVLAAGESATIESLAPGATATLHYSYVVKQSDVVAGFVANTATATADNPSDKTTDVTPGTQTDPTESTEPSLFVEKTADKTSGVKAGDVITYTITATNNGNVDLTGVTVTDELTGFTSEKVDLARGESRDFTTTYTVTEADMVAGSVKNVATATATDPKGNDVPGSGETTSQTEAVDGALTVEKTAAAGSYAAGDKVTYTITVTNTGNVTVSDITVADAKTGFSQSGVTLAVGESKTFSTSYTVTEADLAAGKVDNLATADGTDPAGNDVHGEGTATVDNHKQSDPSNPDDATLKRAFTVDALDDVVYNGGSQAQKPVVRDADGTLLTEGVDYDLTFSGDTTNVTEAGVTVTVTGKGNYTGADEVSYQITPAQLTVTTGSATKPYDGTALTNSELTIEGLAGADFVVGTTTGTQTEVGSSDNTYEIDWRNAKASNYSITEDLGTLTVTPAAPTPTPTPDDGGDTPAPTPTPDDGGTTPTPVTPDDNGGTTPTPTPDSNADTTPTTPVTPSGTATADVTPLPEPLETVVEAMEDVAEAVTGESADGEVIYDEANPLGRTQNTCWVHFWMFVGMAVTAIYGIAVWLHRTNHTRKLRKNMNDLLGGNDDSAAEPAGSTNPAGMEA